MTQMKEFHSFVNFSSKVSIKFWIRKILIKNDTLKGAIKMGRDRQEKKLRESGKVSSDRDPEIHNKGATILESPEESRANNK